MTDFAVHQVLLGRGSGREGWGVLATSSPAAGRLVEDFVDVLRDVPDASAPTAIGPVGGLADGQWWIAHRVAGVQTGRARESFVHALVGLPDDLSMADVVLLHGWPGWLLDPTATSGALPRDLRPVAWSELAVTIDRVRVDVVGAHAATPSGLERLAGLVEAVAERDTLWLRPEPGAESAVWHRLLAALQLVPRQVLPRGWFSASETRRRGRLGVVRPEGATPDLVDLAIAPDGILPARPDLVAWCDAAHRAVVAGRYDELQAEVADVADGAELLARIERDAPDGGLVLPGDDPASMLVVEEGPLRRRWLRSLVRSGASAGVVVGDVAARLADSSSPTLAARLRDDAFALVGRDAAADPGAQWEVLVDGVGWATAELASNRADDTLVRRLVDRKVGAEMERTLRSVASGSLHVSDALQHELVRTAIGLGLLSTLLSDDELLRSLLYAVRAEAEATWMAPVDARQLLEAVATRGWADHLHPLPAWVLTACHAEPGEERRRSTWLQGIAPRLGHVPAVQWAVVESLSDLDLDAQAVMRHAEVQLRASGASRYVLSRLVREWDAREALASAEEVRADGGMAIDDAPPADEGVVPDPQHRRRWFERAVAALRRDPLSTGFVAIVLLAVLIVVLVTLVTGPSSNPGQRPSTTSTSTSTTSTSTTSTSTTSTSTSTTTTTTTGPETTPSSVADDGSGPAGDGATAGADR